MGDYRGTTRVIIKYLSQKQCNTKCSDRADAVVLTLPLVQFGIFFCSGEMGSTRIDSLKQSISSTWRCAAKLT